MALERGLLSLQVRPDHPDFLDLPWGAPLAGWIRDCPRVVQLPRGLSRHEVVFIGYESAIFALKELPPEAGRREYDLLRQFEDRRLPAVTPVGLARVSDGDGRCEVLITRYLDGSLPYRELFVHRGLERYRARLLDAMAGLLVRLHVAGCFWGDCSLSNTLFRRDAGELQAFLVDAETSEVHDSVSDGQRELDISIMEENVGGELADLAAQPGAGLIPDGHDTGVNIRGRYLSLWSEINREVPIRADEGYRIHERIRALNQLGFSVDQVELVAAGDGSQLRMRTIVTDRDYHRHQLHSLTGVVAAERQASLMLQEIRELKALLSRQLDRSVPMSVAAFRWLEERYRPTVRHLGSLVQGHTDVPELYCQVLEHKWFLSERAARDVGLAVAAKDYRRRFPHAPTPLSPRAEVVE